MTAARIHALIAALMGAVGVALWAAASHGGLPNAVTAAQFLLLHACAVLGLTACRKLDLLNSRVAVLSISGMILGCVLFAGDLATRAFAGRGLFPMAAPSGGALLIASWALAAFSALIRRSA